MQEKKPNGIRLLLVLVTLFVSAHFFFKYGKDAYSYYGDSLGYYMYLPSAFIYHNFDSIEKLPLDKEIPSSVIRYAGEFETQTRKSPNGYYINQYTYGVSFFELPFFLVAHLYEKAVGLPANGYSPTYHWMIKMSALTYALLGFFFLYRSLRKKFNETISVLTLCCIMLGTNLFWFTLYQAGMSHLPLFFLYSLLIYLTIVIHKDSKWYQFLGIGIVAGFITIIRPSDIICILIPLLYNIYSIETFRTKLNWIQTHWKSFIACGIFFMIPILPQLIFWKIYAGSFLYNSYLDQSFDFKHPHILEGLFSFSNGWLAYSPIMFIALFGFFFMKRIKEFSLSLWLVLPLYLYIIYSWWCYNYINGLGSRPMIHMYPLLAFPFAAFISYMFQSKKIWQIITAIFLILGCAINYSYSSQQARGELTAEHSSMQFALHTMFKPYLTYRDLVMADVNMYQPKESEISEIKLIVQSTQTDSNNNYFTVQEGNEFPDIKIQIPFSKTQFEGATHFKISGSFYMNEGPYDIYHDQLMVFDINRGDKNLCWESIRIGNKIGKTMDPLPANKEIKLNNSYSKEWDRLYFYVPISSNIQEGDLLKLSIWNISKKSLLIKDLRIESCRAK